MKQSAQLLQFYRRPKRMASNFSPSSFYVYSACIVRYPPHIVFLSAVFPLHESYSCLTYTRLTCVRVKTCVLCHPRTLSIYSRCTITVLGEVRTTFNL